MSSQRDTLFNRILSNCRVDAKTGCWFWEGATSGKGKGAGRGYGRISVQGHTSAVHRVMYSIHYGYIHPSKDVDHLCTNRLCCNPKHLEAVTHKKNCKRRNRK